jgi:hypothetical protein
MSAAFPSEHKTSTAYGKHLGEAAHQATNLRKIDLKTRELLVIKPHRCILKVS